MSRRLLVALLIAAATFTACRKKDPVAPPPPAALSVLAVQPPARSAGYSYDGQIWALFDRSLDPRTVDTTSVFLKKDTQRVSCAIGYEPVSKRIVVSPRSPLLLNATYTVLVTTRVLGRDGAALEHDYLWQFSTTSIGRLDYLSPSPGVPATRVGMLRWSSPGAVPGQLSYEVYAGTDSVAVHNRLVGRLASGPNTYYLPRAYWPGGSRVYWAVTTTNLSTGERLLSPAIGFSVLPGGPSHEVAVPALDWGAIQTGRPTQFCTQNYVPVGTGYTSAIRFVPAASQLGTKVLSARLVMAASSSTQLIPTLQAWACNSSWTACGMTYPGPPYRDDLVPLGTARVGSTSSEIVIDSPGLAAWVEAMLRGADLSGLVFTLTQNQVMNVNTRAAGQLAPTLYVTVYD